MVGQIRLNNWNGDFYDALENRDAATFGEQLLVFLAIIAVLLALVVGQTWLQEMMKVRMRTWLPAVLLDGWLAPGRASRLGITSDTRLNPDQPLPAEQRHLPYLTQAHGT